MIKLALIAVIVKQVLTRNCNGLRDFKVARFCYHNCVSYHKFKLLPPDSSRLWEKRKVTKCVNHMQKKVIISRNNLF